MPDDLTDKAVSWLHAVRAQDPTKPWFAYYSTGCSHAPHQVPVEWSDKYKGKFDGGWDAYREETFARQKKLGVIPADAELTPRPAELPAWDSLSADEKKLYARQMEVYAGYSANADWNVGRLLDAVEEMGELDDTLVIYIWGDNGASLEGTLTGSFNELTMLNGVPLTPEQQLSLIDQYGGLDAWGTDATAPHYAAAWAWAGNCPFQWGKQVASHLGGTRNGMVVAWPRRIRESGKRQPVHARHRHRADDPRGGRHPRGQGRRRRDADADGGHELPLHLRRRDRAGAPHAAVLRDLRQPGHVQGRLVGLRQARPPALGRDAADDGQVRARQVRPRGRRLGAVLPARRLLAGQGPRRPAPGEARRAQAALLGGGGEAQGAAAPGRLLGVLRHPAAHADRDQAHVLRRRRERPGGDAPEDLRPLLRDHGRPPRARGRRRRRHRGRGRRHGRLLPVRQGRQAPAHLQLPGRRGLSPGVRRSRCPRAT